MIHELGKPGQLKINNKDFQENYKNIIISNLQERFNVQKIEPIKWTEIGGLDVAKVIINTDVYKHKMCYSY